MPRSCSTSCPVFELPNGNEFGMCCMPAKGPAIPEHAEGETDFLDEDYDKMTVKIYNGYEHATTWAFPCT